MKTMSDQLTRNIKQRFGNRLQTHPVYRDDDGDEFTIDCGDGWYPLLHITLSHLEDLGHPFYITSVEARLGGLHVGSFFPDENHEEYLEVLERTRDLSKNTCLLCGESIDRNSLDDGWMVPYCRPCWMGNYHQRKHRNEQFIAKIQRVDLTDLDPEESLEKNLSEVQSRIPEISNETESGPDA